jgi:hypothetical protein
LFKSVLNIFHYFLPTEIPNCITVFQLYKLRSALQIRKLLIENHTVWVHALALVAKYLPLGSHSTSVTP